MAVPPATKAVVVLGLDGAEVARQVHALRAEGCRAAGFVGDDDAEARAMAAEVLGAVDEVVRI